MTFNLRTIHSSITFLVFSLLTISCQQENEKVVYEQKALDFFVDSILLKDTTFNKLSIYFNDTTRNWVTPLNPDWGYGSDSVFSPEQLKEIYKYQEDSTSKLWDGLNKPSIRVISKSPIIHGLIPEESKDYYNLHIMQFREFGENIFVHLWLDNEEVGYDIDLVMDHKGKVKQKRINDFIY